MKNLIVANWKMNPANQKEAKNLFEKIKKGISRIKNTEVVICPPFVFLSALKGLILGAQNVYSEEKGAFTGEISVSMLKNLGCKYVIVGHSEKRAVGEKDKMINLKLKLVLKNILSLFFVLEKHQSKKKRTKPQEY